MTDGSTAFDWPGAEDLARSLSAAMRPLVAALLLLGAGCDAPSRAPRTEPRAQSPSPAPPPRVDEPVESAPDPVRVEALEGAEPPTFVMRGGPRGSALLVFLHGMCGHGLGYAQSFQFSAAERGTLIAPQGDVRCGQGPWASWSGDLEKLDRRIIATFRAVRHEAHDANEEPFTDIVLIGYSQGASRAAALARRHPERYTRLISIGAPAPPSGAGLGHLRAALMMAGEYDRQDVMKVGARSLRRAGVPVTFQQIPQATHGAMGPTPEKTMGQALRWLFESSR